MVGEKSMLLTMSSRLSLLSPIRSPPSLSGRVKTPKLVTPLLSPCMVELMMLEPLLILSYQVFTSFPVLPISLAITLMSSLVISEYWSNWASLLLVSLYPASLMYPRESTADDTALPLTTTVSLFIFSLSNVTLMPNCMSAMGLQST